MTHASRYMLAATKQLAADRRRIPTTDPTGERRRPMSGDQRPGERLSDEEYSELGKTIGMLFQRIMRARKEPDGGQASVLAMLARCGPIRSSDLAKELYLDQSTVSRHVAHLETAGLV